MKPISKPALASLIALLATAYGCLEIEKLPPEPRIEFRDFTVFDTTDILGNEAKAGRLVFYFEDGDGDLGLAESQSQTPEERNLFLTLYRKTGEVMVPAETTDPLYPSPYRIPYMERLGQNKILKGEITVVLLYLFYEESDIIMYDFFIRDRALHDSNIESTCEIALGENGSCNEAR